MRITWQSKAKHRGMQPEININTESKHLQTYVPRAPPTPPARKLLRADSAVEQKQETNKNTLNENRY